MLEHKDDTLAVRNRLATAMFTAWWLPFSRFGVIHGDPHLGNYTVFDARRASPPASTCSTTAASASSRRAFVGGVVDLYNGLRKDDDALVVHAYETWGFKQAVARADRHSQHLGALHLRAADGRPRAHHRRRREARRIRPPPGVRGAAGAARRKGPVTVPREFVLMDRAAIGLGGVFLHLRAELNFHRLFEEAMEDFSVKRRGRRGRRRRSSALGSRARRRVWHAVPPARMCRDRVAAHWTCHGVSG